MSLKNLFHRKSKLQRGLESVLPKGVGAALPDLELPKKVGRSGLLAAGGAFGMAAGSALVSSRRRRSGDEDGGS